MTEMSDSFDHVQTIIKVFACLCMKNMIQIIKDFFDIIETQQRLRRLENHITMVAMMIDFEVNKWFSFTKRAHCLRREIRHLTFCVQTVPIKYKIILQSLNLVWSCCVLDCSSPLKLESQALEAPEQGSKAVGLVLYGLRNQNGK